MVDSYEKAKREAWESCRAKQTGPISNRVAHGDSYDKGWAAAVARLREEADEAPRDEIVVVHFCAALLEQEAKGMAENKPEEVTLELHPVVYRMLQKLNDTGLYGLNIEETAERLLCRQLQQQFQGLLVVEKEAKGDG